MWHTYRDKQTTLWDSKGLYFEVRFTSPRVCRRLTHERSTKRPARCSVFMVAMVGRLKSRPLTYTILYLIGWRLCCVDDKAISLDNPIARRHVNLTDFLLLLGCPHWHVFQSTLKTRRTVSVYFYSSLTQRWIYRGSMSKDNRHDGRRRGAGQHRLGPRVSQGGDGRERSRSNSSGSSHGGGKNKNTSTTALKVRHDILAGW